MGNKSMGNKPKPKPSLSTVHKKWYFIIISALVITILVTILMKLHLMGDIEKRASDYRFKHFPLTQEKIEDVVLVAIDESSLREFVNNRISWPWPREFYAIAINYFNSVGAKGVLFDILFYEPDYISDEYDEVFAESMARYDKTVLAALIVPDSTKISNKLTYFNLDVDDNIHTFLPNTKGISAPIESFLDSATSIGTVNVEPDADGIIRRVPLFNKIDDVILPQMPMAALFLPNTGIEASSIKIKNNKWYFNGVKLPVDSNGDYLINWYGEESFHYYPFRSIVQSYVESEKGMEPTLSPNIFKDKFVIIGATAPGLYDLKTTPVSKVYPGFEIWATVLNNFQNNDFIKCVPPAITFIYVFLLSCLLIYLFVRNPLKIGNILIVATFAATILLPLFLWRQSRWQLTAVSPLFSLTLSIIYISIISYVSEGKSKKEIKKAFSRYLHPQIVEQLADNPYLVDLQGKEYQATLLFTDIANFTNFSETQEPKALIALLNKYFNTLTGTILDNDGMLDKYMGDGLMAVFGAPLVSSNHEYNACKATVMHKKMWSEHTVTKDKIEDYSIMFHLHTRIGLNTGSVVAGNMGSTRRVDYTVIGDAVNLASRLESINKFYGTSTIISESTYLGTKGKFLCRELDSIQVKGKLEPTKIFELIDFIEAKDSSYSWIDEYVEALSFYRIGEWEKAIQLFSKLATSAINDGPAKIMLDRCYQLKENAPQDWNGVYKWELK